MNGLSVYVYRDSSSHFGCTFDGLSDQFNRLILLVPGVDVFTARADCPALRLQERRGKGGPMAVPAHAPPGCYPMFGGNYISTSDSRFPSDQPIPVHDRFEDAQDRINMRNAFLEMYGEPLKPKDQGIPLKAMLMHLGNELVQRYGFDPATGLPVEGKPSTHVLKELTDFVNTYSQAREILRSLSIHWPV
jgi:hypothetical protein